MPSLWTCNGCGITSKTKAPITEHILGIRESSGKLHSAKIKLIAYYTYRSIGGKHLRKLYVEQEILI